MFIARDSRSETEHRKSFNPDSTFSGTLPPNSSVVVDSNLHLLSAHNFDRGYRDTHGAQSSDAPDQTGSGVAAAQERTLAALSIGVSVVFLLLLVN